MSHIKSWDTSIEVKETIWDERFLGIETDVL